MPTGCINCRWALSALPSAPCFCPTCRGACAQGDVTGGGRDALNRGDRIRPGPDPAGRGGADGHRAAAGHGAVWPRRLRRDRCQMPPRWRWRSTAPACRHSCCTRSCSRCSTPRGHPPPVPLCAGLHGAERDHRRRAVAADRLAGGRLGHDAVGTGSWPGNCGSARATWARRRGPTPACATGCGDPGVATLAMGAGALGSGAGGLARLAGHAGAALRRPGRP